MTEPYIDRMKNIHNGVSVYFSASILFPRFIARIEDFTIHTRREFGSCCFLLVYVRYEYI